MIPRAVNIGDSSSRTQTSRTWYSAVKGCKPSERLRLSMTCGDITVDISLYHQLSQREIRSGNCPLRVDQASHAAGFSVGFCS
jgi:hypothetical protein